MFKLLFIAVCIKLVASQDCYWNRECPYLLHSSKTPYQSIRGDIRDFAQPEGCEAVNIWSLHRHGNRNPGNSATLEMRELSQLRDDIIASFDAGNSQLCAQDIDMMRQWTWNETMDEAMSFLTGTGYEELYDIATRIRLRYPHLLDTSDEDLFYFRPTNEQRTVTSAMAFVHGLTEGTNLTLQFDGPYDRDDVIRPYENCDRYQEVVRGGDTYENEVNAFYETEDYASIREGVQQRLGIDYQFSNEDIYNLYDLCRFYRSWEDNLQSPWCAAFTNHDLLLLDYRDDVRHYHRNGYGSWVNVELGRTAMKDLYENFVASVEGQGKNIISYFTHDTMMEMVFCSLGLYQDDYELLGTNRNEDRLWRVGLIGSFSTNLIAVLNRCGTEHRVQIFINEKETELCPSTGCTWDQFLEKFQPFSSSTLDFCSMDYVVPEVDRPEAENLESENPEAEGLEAENSQSNNAVVNASLVSVLMLGGALNFVL